MTTPTDPSDTPRPRGLVDRLVRPPLADGPFWIIQGAVLVIVALHYFLDVHPSVASGVLPSGLPVAVLVVPIGYAALRYGLAGSLGTTAWTLVLWLPDLLLPHNEGHAGDDLLNFAVIVVVAVVFGRRVETERSTQARIDSTNARALAVEAGYHRLFESTRSPIVVLDESVRVSDANPAATALFGPVTGQPLARVLGPDVELASLSGRVLTLENGHDYRLDLVDMPFDSDERRQQLSFEDVTEERSEERRARLFARQIVDLEEDQRRRLARELHDEPLQLFLHLARRLELLAHHEGVTEKMTAELERTRNQALEAATRLRSLARDLRPPALDQLGLVPALSSLVTEIDDQGEATISLAVHGGPTRLAPEVELGAFRIVQESLRNAQRHAGAHHVDVVLDFAGEDLRLRVVDDGQGFDPHAAPATGSASLGLVGMRERARLLGGAVVLRSTPGIGTVVEATLPTGGRETNPAPAPAPAPAR